MAGKDPLDELEELFGGVPLDPSGILPTHTAPGYSNLTTTRKITPASYSKASGYSIEALFLAVLKGEPQLDFKVAPVSTPHFTGDHPAGTIRELREDGEEAVELWYRGVRLGIVDLTAWAKLTEPTNIEDQKVVESRMKQNPGG